MQSPQSSSEVILALDIGGTFIKSALFQNGQLIRKLPQVPSRSEGTREEIGEAIRTAIRQAGAPDRLAVSIPGPFDYKIGIFRAEHKFAAVCGCAFSEFSGGLPSSFVHDANAFLLGELLHGAGRGFLRVGAVTLGTGLGAAFAIGGDLQLNAQGSPTDSVSLWNKPYRDGIAEDYVSARALLKDYPAPGGKEIAEAAEAGDPRALEAWRRYSLDLYALLADWKARLELDVIVVGGQLRSGLRFGVPVPAGLNLRFSSLDGDAPLWGALEASGKAETLPEPGEDMIRRSILSTGNVHRFHEFFRRAESGCELTLGVLGGSITRGAACPEPEKRYHGVLLDWLRSQFPRSRFSLVNAGIGATDSVYGSFRAQRDLLSHKPDLVVLEYAVNDTDQAQWAQSYEGCIRQILADGCPLLLLFMTHNHQRNCQRFQTVLGRHYGLPMVSWHDAVMPELMRGSLAWENLSPDAVHPNPAAHSLAGKLLCSLMEKIRTQADEPESPIPEPLISKEFQYTFLLEKDSFRPETQEGWEETPGEEPQKYWFRRRWFASRPGSRMTFSFVGASLWISYLGIQGPAGRISVRVDDCPPVLVDSYFPHDWPDPKQMWAPVLTGLPEGKHRAVITLLDEHHPEGGTEFYFCAAAGTGKESAK